MGNIVICLESILFFLSLKERKGKYCCELLSRQKISRTVPIKAQQKFYLNKTTKNKPEGASVTPVPKRFIDKVIFHLYGPNRSFHMFPIYIIQCTPTCAAYCALLYNIEINSNPSALHTVNFTSYNKTFKTSFVFWLLAWQQVSFS